MTSAWVWAVMLLFFSAELAPCFGREQSPSPLDFRQPPSTFDGLMEAARRVRWENCRTSDCRAVVVVDGVLEIEDSRDVNMGYAHVPSGDQSRIACQQLESLLLRHKALYRSTCAMAARIMSRINLASDTDGLFPGVTLTQAAIDMDLLDHGHCATRLMATLPCVPDNDRIRINSRALCLDDHPHARAARNALARGAVDRGY